MKRSDIDFLQNNTIIKQFRVYDAKHNQWFNGSTSKERIKNKSDSVSYFGEILSINGTASGENLDVWRNDEEIKSTCEIPNWLIVCQNTNQRDVNGRYIYEYDLVSSIKGRYIGVVIYYKNQYIVIYDKYSVKNGEFAGSLSGNLKIQGSMLEKEYREEYIQRIRNWLKIYGEQC